jgi:hypothetical protein
LAAEVAAQDGKKMMIPGEVMAGEEAADPQVVIVEEAILPAAETTPEEEAIHQAEEDLLHHAVALHRCLVKRFVA